ncbi:MAG: isoprenyl transferase [Phycisphaeraceae bacterium]
MLQKTLDARTTAAPAPQLGLPPAELPRHVAIIMDGNGRWAVRRGLDRTEGHRHGAEAVREIVTEAAKLGIDVLTLYSFSTENWTRSADEVGFLMNLYAEYLVRERDTLMRNNVRFVQIGRRAGLPRKVLAELDDVTATTAKNTGLTLVLALNYGSRTEITDAVRAIAAKVKAGELEPEAISEQVIAEHLYTADLPDPDLLVRTAGEMRLSNYLLWQISYAELYVADVCWPEFDVAQFHEALRSYARRQRKFGSVV